MKVKIKRLSNDAVIPKYAKQGDSGFDLVATEDVVIAPGETKVVPTGLAFDIPDFWEIQVRPRSGVTTKTTLRVQLGTIDSGYKGEVGVIVDNISRDNWSNAARALNNSYVEKTRGLVPSGSYIIRRGDRIAQGVIAPVIKGIFEETDHLSESERGEGGFGSTGVTV